VSGDGALMALLRVIARHDDAAALALLAATPELARARIVAGASRADPKTYFLEEIRHHVYAGDTALHLAAAAYRVKVMRKLLAMGADVAAQNRRGQVPLHYAVDGGPGTTWWNPSAQAQAVAVLLKAGGDIHAVDKGGVTALHRAVRNRCTGAVRALLEGGADMRRKSKSGSTAVQLATQTTGRSGTGLAETKAQQAEIVALLNQFGG